jgi:hypothetical protein
LDREWFHTHVTTLIAIYRAPFAVLQWRHSVWRLSSLSLPSPSIGIRWPMVRYRWPVHPGSRA